LISVRRMRANCSTLRATPAPPALMRSTSAR
jgi:hypothetical protein